MALLLMLLASCGGSRDSFTLKGEFKNLKEGNLFLYSQSSDWDDFDTIRVRGGEFEVTHAAADTMLVTLLYPSYLHTTIVAIPGHTIRIKGDANSLAHLKVKGDDDNEMLTALRHEMIGARPDSIVRLASGFISRNPGSFAALAALQDYIIDVEQPDWRLAKQLVELMAEATPHRPSVMALRTMVRGRAATQIGGRLPRFNALTLAGDTVTADTYRNHWLLVSFYSTWYPEHYKSVNALRKHLRAYGDSVRVLNVCLDADTVGLRRRVQRDSVVGDVVCDRMSWNSPIVRMFGVGSVPQNILYDKRGRVVARDIKEDEMADRLKQLIH